MTGSSIPVLELDRVVHRFHGVGRTRRLSHPRPPAVDGVSLRVDRGETVAVVGESGSGKTTLARCAVRLLAPTDGAVRIGGVDVTRARGQRLRALRDEVQMVFQDPTASLNPRRRARGAVEANLGLRGVDRSRRGAQALSLLERVGLGAKHADRRPHELSVGERQRVAIARALASEPSALVLDEPVAALDARVQARVLDLLLLLKQELGLAYLLISHDVGLVRRLADRVLVMRAGRAVESGLVGDVVSDPHDPYTRELVAAAPVAPAPDRR